MARSRAKPDSTTEPWWNAVVGNASTGRHLVSEETSVRTRPLAARWPSPPMPTRYGRSHFGLEAQVISADRSTPVRI